MQHMRLRLPSTIISVLLAIFFVLAITRPPVKYYPMVEVETRDPTGGLVLSFLLDSRPTLFDCEALTGNISRRILEVCSICRVTQLRCNNTLNKSQEDALSEQALDIPSGRMKNGVVLFRSNNPNLALAACQETAKKSSKSAAPVECFSANSPRPNLHVVHPLWPISNLLLLIVTALSAVWLTVWLIIKYDHLHAHLSHDYCDTGPQKYHEEPTPRIGGLAIMAGLLAAGGFMLLSEKIDIDRNYGLLLIAGIPAFLGGLIEDLTKKVGVTERLLLTMLSGAIAAWLLDAVLPRLDIPGVDNAMLWPPFAVAITIFAVGGVANAVNIIDGYNGLASGFAIIAFTTLSYVAYLVGDNFVFFTAVSMASALLGFFFWNWPGGKIFLGDGGAYLTGFLLAELSVFLVARNPTVSPWFPLAILIYPIFETLYTIYRRKLMNGLSPGQPDNKHLHQLIHDNLVTHASISETPFCNLQTNNQVAKFLLAPVLVMAVVCALFWKSTGLTLTASVAYCVFYILNYRRIANREL